MRKAASVDFSKIAFKICCVCLIFCFEWFLLCSVKLTLDTILMALIWGLIFSLGNHLILSYPISDRARGDALEKRRRSRIGNHHFSFVSFSLSCLKSRNSTLNIAWHFSVTGVPRTRRHSVKPVYSVRKFCTVYIQSHPYDTKIGLCNEFFIF